MADDTIDTHVEQVVQDTARLSREAGFSQNSQEKEADLYRQDAEMHIKSELERGLSPQKAKLEFIKNQCEIIQEVLGKEKLPASCSISETELSTLSSQPNSAIKTPEGRTPATR